MSRRVIRSANVTIQAHPPPRLPSSVIELLLLCRSSVGRHIGPKTLNKNARVIRVNGEQALQNEFLLSDSTFERCSNFTAKGRKITLESRAP